MPKVVMYCTRSCPYCARAEKLLKKKGVKIEIIDVGRDRQLWKEMEKLTKRNTVPQIFIDEYHVGGFDDLSGLDRQGKLDDLLGNS
ncbi:MAG: glutaredoxin 3 [Gammaproteobacteria bacterium]|nr:glutaredoxin 3 [Gammaproteobacteria bacterium]